MPKKTEQTENKWMSRKLLVAVAGAVGIPVAELPSESWLVVIAYLAAQGVIDAVKTWRSE